MSDITSARLDTLARKMPFIALVTQTLPGFRTPRTVMQVWVASTTTATPLAPRSF
jgi:hypothetical protein